MLVRECAASRRSAMSVQNACELLRRIVTDTSLARRSKLATADELVALAASMGLPCTEAEIRDAIHSGNALSRPVPTPAGMATTPAPTPVGLVPTPAPAGLAATPAPT